LLATDSKISRSVSGVVLTSRALTLFSMPAASWTVLRVEAFFTAPSMRVRKVLSSRVISAWLTPNSPNWRTACSMLASASFHLPGK